MSVRDALVTFALDIVGALLVGAAFAWAGFDASQHAGRVATTTLFGVLVVGTTGGFLISKHKTIELLDFLFEQARRFLALKLPSAGSGDGA